METKCVCITINFINIHVYTFICVYIYINYMHICAYIHTVWGKSRFTAVSTQNTELSLVLLINYCIIFHTKNYKPTFAPPCIIHTHYTHTHICIYIYKHTYIHTHTHYILKIILFKKTIRNGKQELLCQSQRRGIHVQIWVLRRKSQHL